MAGDTMAVCVSCRVVIYIDQQKPSDFWQFWSLSMGAYGLDL